MATLKDSGVLGNLVVSNQINAKNIKKNGSDVISTSDIGTGLSLSGTTINLKTATTSSIGGIKLAGTRTSSISTTQGGTTSGRYYGLEIDSDGTAFVNVPWTDNNTTYTAGTGLSLSGTKFSVNALSTSEINALFS